MSIITIAMTGGPCAGKTTVTEEVKKHFGDQVLVMPEVASILLNNGFPKPGIDVQFSERWTKSFQNSIFPVQLNMEHEFQAMAREGIARVILCDRGLLDGAAYLGKGVEAYLDMFGMTIDEVNARYDRVIHLESLAVSNPELYTKLKSTNPARYEDADQAKRGDYSLREVWQSHPEWSLITSGGGIKSVTDQVFNLISSYLTTEIEVKYLLSSIPPEVILGKGTRILQGYIPLTHSQGEIRLRRMGETCYVTFKSDGQVSRQECERKIDPFAFELGYAETMGRRIEKIRYCIPHESYTLEIDIYKGHLNGLITMECELPDKEAVTNFRLPEWAMNATNVTNDRRYKNKSLAMASRIPE